MEICRTSTDNLDKDGRPPHLKAAMRAAGLYEKCRRCPLLKEYKDEGIDLECKSNEATVDYYQRCISSAVQFCCSKEKAELNAADISHGTLQTFIGWLVWETDSNEAQSMTTFGMLNKKILIENREPQALNKLHHKVHNMIGRYFSAMQYVALMWFCKKKKI
uniref:Uncharacterized protein n=1 Tax=Romanomermis culicivorax TaxID=13658 RepID=A0A915KAT3_ROMCU